MTISDKNKFSKLFFFVIYSICLNNKFEGLAFKYSKIILREIFKLLID